MKRKRLLDLFCGAGGAAMGYYQAGFDEIVGIDINPQKNYPFDFIQADALHPPLDLNDFHLIHASPPCQNFSALKYLNMAVHKRTFEYPDLIQVTRDVCRGFPYVIENVVGAPLRTSLMLCGTMFGLRVIRHRIFEGSHLILNPFQCQHTRTEVGVYGQLNGRRMSTRSDGTELRVAKDLTDARKAMGIDWMDALEITQSIPPAYTEFIGKHLLAIL